MLGKLWRDPVWSKVIAAALIAIAAAAWTTIGGAWPAVGTAISQGWAWLGQSNPVANWLLILLGFCALAVLAVLGVVAWATLFERTDAATGSSWTGYTSDEFYGVKWRWRFGSDGYIFDLFPFCRRCDYQLQPADGYHLGQLKTTFRCDDCGHDAGLVDGTPYDVENKVKRKIQQHLRNSTWPGSEA